MKAMNIYLCGVGGQGISLLSSVITSACMEAGYQVMGVDTHGLAQRGGTVVSHLRIGKKVFTPMIPDGQADLVIALERLEGLRGALSMLKPGGTLVYYQTVLQPHKVRSGEMAYPSDIEVLERLRPRGINVEALNVENLPDYRMQNVALLGKLASMNLIEDIGSEVFEEVIKTAVPEHALETNLAVFKQAMDS